MTAPQIIAATFTIAFEGLMLFQGPSESQKTEVILVHAPVTHHNPRVELYDSEMNKIGKFIDLKPGDSIKFSLPAPGPAETDDRFNKYTPTLRDYIRIGNVHEKVVQKDLDHAGTHAIVQLPWGHLTVYYTFRKEVRLTRFLPTTRCFPRFVLHEATTDVDVTLTITRTAADPLGPISIPKDGLVLISNGADPHDLEHQKPHFPEYDKLLSRFGWLASSTILESDCYTPDTEKGTNYSNPAALKKLTLLRDRLPSGDCGPVDNP